MTAKKTSKIKKPGRTTPRIIDGKKAYQLAYADKLAGMTYEQIADKYGVTLAAVRSWQVRYWRDMQPDADKSANSSQATPDNLQKDIHTEIADRAKIKQWSGPRQPPIGTTFLPVPAEEIIPRIINKQMAETKPAALIDACDIDYASMLEPRQRRLVQEYLIDYNATQAAIRSGYPPHNAGKVADKILNIPHVAACLAQAEAERSRRTGLNAELVDLEIGRLMRINPTDVIDLKTGRVREDASPDDLAAIQSIKVKQTPSKSGMIMEYEVRLTPKEKMIELAARRQGLLIDRRQVENHVTYESTEQRQARINELLRASQADTFDTTATVIRDEDDNDHG